MKIQFCLSLILISFISVNSKSLKLSRSLDLNRKKRQGYGDLFGYNTNNNQYQYQNNYNNGYNNNNLNYQYNNLNSQNMFQQNGYTTPSSIIMNPDFRPQPESYQLSNNQFYASTSSSSSSSTKSDIPVITAKIVAQEFYSKSFDPYAGMTTRPIPVNPQALWFSRYADLSAPIAALPFNNYKNI